MSSENENIPKLGGVGKFKKLPKLPMSTMLRPESTTRSSHVEFKNVTNVVKLTNFESFFVVAR